MGPFEKSLYNAIRDNDVKEIQRLLGDENSQNRRYANKLLNGGGLLWLTTAGYYPLHWAACDGNIEAFQALLNCGANPTVQNSGGYTPFEIAKYWLRNDAHQLARIQNLLINWSQNRFANNPSTLRQVQRLIGLEENGNLNIPATQRSAASILGGEIGGIAIFAVNGFRHIVRMQNETNAIREGLM